MELQLTWSDGELVALCGVYRRRPWGCGGCVPRISPVLEPAEEVVHPGAAHDHLLLTQAGREAAVYHAAVVPVAVVAEEVHAAS